MPTPVRARISRAARMPSSVCVGGMRMSTIATSGGCASTSRRRSSAGRALGDDLEAGLGEQPRDALAHAACRPRRALRARDLRPHLVPFAGRAPDAQAPSSASTRSARPRRPEPPRASAPPTPSSAISTISVPSSRVTSHARRRRAARTSRRSSAPRRRGSRRRPRRVGQAAVDVDRHLARHRRARRERLERRRAGRGR